MFNTSWPVLLVDDEPDVLTLSRLIMQDFTVYGLPLELHTAASKADAIRLMETELVPLLPTVPPPRVAVAFIDVVMESDKAGLELCEYIRNIMGNKVVQLFIRTGQPGVAPEREVIDHYDINGYFTKAEATEDKLYSLVKSGVRQYLSYMTATATQAVLSRMSMAGSSRDTLRSFMQKLPMMQREGHFLFVDGEAIGGTLGEEKARALAAQLDRQTGQSLGDDGDKFVVDEDQNMLMKVAGDGRRAEVLHVIAGDWKFLPPETVKAFLHGVMSAGAVLWKQTG
jgi:CheY-like chemotaxis protein